MKRIQACINQLTYASKLEGNRLKTSFGYTLRKGENQYMVYKDKELIISLATEEDVIQFIHNLNLPRQMFWSDERDCPDCLEGKIVRAGGFGMTQCFTCSKNCGWEFEKDL